MLPAVCMHGSDEYCEISATLCLQEAVKGLPSLAPKKKKAEGEATADKQAAAAE